MKKYRYILVLVLLGSLGLLGGCELFKQPDMENPTVQFLGLSPGQEISGIIKVKVDLRDNEGIFKAELSVNNYLLETLQSPPWEFTLNTGNYSLGAHILDVTVFDTSGNMLTKTLGIKTVPASGASGLLLSESFNNYPLTTIGGADFSSWFNPPLSFGGQKSCIISVENDPSAAPGGPKAVHIVDSTVKGDSVALGARFLAIPTGQVSFDFYLKEKSTFLINLAQEAPDSDPVFSVSGLVIDTTEGSFLVLKGITKPLTLHVWHNLRIAFDCGSETYLYFIDGVEVKTPLAFKTGNPDITYLNMFSISTSTDGPADFGGSMISGNFFLRNYRVSTVVDPGIAYAYAQAPGSFTVSTNEQNQINLGWMPIPGASKYQVYRSGSQTGAFIYVAAVPAPSGGGLLTVSMTETMPENYPITLGQMYYFKVLAVDAQGIPGEFTPSLPGKAVTRDFPDFEVTYNTYSSTTGINLPSTRVIKSIDASNGHTTYTSTYSERMAVKSTVFKQGTVPENTLSALWSYINQNGLLKDVAQDPNILRKTGAVFNAWVTITQGEAVYTLDSVYPLNSKTEIDGLVSLIETAVNSWATAP